MNDRLENNCERFEAMIVAYFDADGVHTRESQELKAHLATCASCRESLEISSRMESALVSRRSEVPAVDAFLPAFARARAVSAAHPRLVAAFRAVMSPAGIAIVLVFWSAMLALHFRHAIAEVFVWTSKDRFSALLSDMSNALLAVSGGDPYTLTAIYVALALLVLASTGAITMRYIRND
jgi:Putative zinc-finger